MPRAGKTKLAYLKCRQCRHDKQKCLPVWREWPEKCDRCTRYGYECSENFKKADYQTTDHTTKRSLHNTTLLVDAEWDDIKPTNECLQKLSLCIQIENLRELRTAASLAGQDPELDSMLNEAESFYEEVLQKSVQRAEELERKNLHHEAELIYQHLLEFGKATPKLDDNRRMSFVLKLASLQERRGDIWGAQKTLHHVFATVKETSADSLQPSSIQALRRLATLHSRITTDLAVSDVHHRRMQFSGGRTLPSVIYHALLSASGLHKLSLECATLCGFGQGMRAMSENSDVTTIDSGLYESSPGSDDHDSVGQSLITDIDGTDVNSAHQRHRSVSQAATFEGSQKEPSHSPQRNGTTMDGDLRRDFSDYDDTEMDLGKATSPHHDSTRVSLSLHQKPTSSIPYPQNASNVTAKRGQKSEVKSLIAKGGIVNADDCLECGALHTAVARGNEEVVKQLLERGADVNAVSLHHGTALQAAVSANDERMVRLLLESGAKVNRDFGRALYFAASEGHDNIVRLLLEKGANANGGSASALRIAASKNHETVVRLLLEAGANVNANNSYHESVLHEAVSKGHEKIVRLLLEKGADVSLKDYQGQTALDTAESQGYTNLVRLLREQARYGPHPHSTED